MEAEEFAIENSLSGKELDQFLFLVKAMLTKDDKGAMTFLEEEHIARDSKVYIMAKNYVLARCKDTLRREIEG